MKTMPLTLAAAVLATAGSAATAANYFSTIPSVDSFESVLELNIVRSDASGTVQIETLDGEVVGMTEVSAGANADLRIQLDGVTNQDLVAVLYHGDMVVAERDINVDNF